MTNVNPEESKATSGSEEAKATPNNPWDDVIRDFQSLGESIANAVQDAVQDERRKESLHDVKQGLDNVVSQVSKTVTDASHSSQAEAIKTEMKKAMGDVKGFGDKVYGETRPFLVTALEGLSEGLQILIERLQDEDATSTQPSAEDEAPKAASESKPSTSKPD